MLRNWPQHGIVEWTWIKIYFNGLNVATKKMLDAVVGGSLCSDQPEATQTLIDEMATNGYQWSSAKNKLAKISGIQEMDVLTTLAAQDEGITKRLDTLQMPTQALVMAYEA